jgi:hypothetical protein
VLEDVNSAYLLCCGHSVPHLVCHSLGCVYLVLQVILQYNRMLKYNSTETCGYVIHRVKLSQIGPALGVTFQFISVLCFVCSLFWKPCLAGMSSCYSSACFTSRYQAPFQGIGSEFSLQSCVCCCDISDSVGFVHAIYLNSVVVLSIKMNPIPFYRLLSQTELVRKRKSSRNSAVGIETGYGLDGRGVGVRVPVGAKFFSSPQRSDRFWRPPSLLSNGYRGGGLSGPGT